jgi:hypothetical protein
MRSALSADGHSISHSRALELLARQHGYKDWNTLHAAAGNHTGSGPVAVGERVRGTYLSQPFDGEVIGLARLPTHGRYRITIQFDAPVDVVTFDSFSAFRKRVTVTVDEHGVSPQKTSNGEPHMRLQI